MTKLGDAVAQDLARRGKPIDQSRIERILLDAGVSSTASRGVPARLRVRRVRVTGEKLYSETPKDETPAADMKTAPINLDWQPGDGVNGVGSEANLRGKSSVLHFAMWALTGRSHLQADVESWVDHVSAEFHVDEVPLFVEFDVRDGMPTGTVTQKTISGLAVLGSFSGHVEFESLMGSVMLDRLRLDAISVFSKGAETEHAWPSYAAALTVHADKLDPIVGNESTLKTRILQMFVGTRWAAIDAQVATALNAADFKREVLVEKRRAAASVTTSALEQAENRVREAQAALEAFDPTEPDVDSVFAFASDASARAQEAHELSMQLMLARSALLAAQEQLRTEQMSRQAAEEDAVARRLFNGMTPTACPRCAAEVTAARYAAEVTAHECSMCKNGLKLPADPDEAASAVAAENEVEEPVDPLEALQAAVAEAKADIHQLEGEFREADQSRLDAQNAAQRGRSSLGSARARLQAEIELARAESALEALREVAGPQPSSSIDGEDHFVLETASKLTKKWVKEDQDPLLGAVSLAIARLAREFGSTNIIAVTLKGNGNMDVEKGGAVTGYSGLTNGEKLRIKLAAAIALIEIGHSDGVGRHPGLLFVDSPAAEEIPEADLRTMLKAMATVAEKIDLQIVVATRHGRILSGVIGPPNLLVATGSNFVW
ncbi:hypothetical protein [Micromonospora inaquosa]|uniref:Large ATP-binding protein n=1 Tax=Micromonospora inaquosa TaxID=2203716 RepID=A0A3N9W4V1_9ACTN|nr:hypothetical protein [Micromonospora inaquosa]RQW95811.1 hypothetical protein DLJ59_32215 [Micromonospora inaquosa]